MHYLENKALAVKCSWVSFTKPYTKFYCNAVTVHSNWMWTALNSLSYSLLEQSWKIHNLFSVFEKSFKNWPWRGMLIWHTEIFPKGQGKWVSLISWFLHHLGKHNAILFRGRGAGGGGGAVNNQILWSSGRYHFSDLSGKLSMGWIVAKHPFFFVHYFKLAAKKGKDLSDLESVVCKPNWILTSQ